MNDDDKGAIEFWFDLISPFAYLASTQIEAIAARHGRRTDWKPTLLGVSVLKVMGMKPLLEYPMKGEYLQRDMQRFAALYDVPFRRHGLKGINALNAERAFLWIKAQDAALATRFARTMFARLWSEGQDITTPEACADVAAGLGIDSKAMLDAIASPEGKQALNASVEEALAKGVFGVPFFIVDGEKFFGNDHIWMLEHWLAHGTWSAQSGKRS